MFAAPVIAYQLWRFIAPGLYAKEKRFAVPFVVLITIGSIGAGLFTHYVMFPATIGFLAGFHSRSMTFMPRVEDTFDLYKMMLLGMIVVFQIPTVVFFLAKMHLVTARLLWRHVKYAVLIAFVAAAVLTPSSDPWNQMIFAAPMLVLYVASIGIAWAAAPRHARDQGSGSRDQGSGIRDQTGSDGGAPLRLIVTGAVIEQAWAHGKRSRIQSRVNLRSRP